MLHLAESGGKRVRPMLSLLSAQYFSKDPRPAVPVGIASEMIHMATLVHDDVIDRAETRRGRKTVNQIWGNHVSVLAGDALLAKALVILVDERAASRAGHVRHDLPHVRRGNRPACDAARHVPG